MNPGVRYCIWLQYLRSSFCSPQESITPLHKGQLRGQEGKSAKKAQGRRRIKIKKKKPRGSPASCVKSWLFPNETRAPIVKPKSSLVATISSEKKRKRSYCKWRKKTNDCLMLTWSFILNPKSLKGNIKSLLSKFFLRIKMDDWFACCFFSSAPKEKKKIYINVY